MKNITASEHHRGPFTDSILLNMFGKWIYYYENHTVESEDIQPTYQAIKVVVAVWGRWLVGKYIIHNYWRTAHY